SAKGSETSQAASCRRRRFFLFFSQTRIIYRRAHGFRLASHTVETRWTARGTARASGCRAHPDAAHRGERARATPDAADRCGRRGASCPHRGGPAAWRSGEIHGPAARVAGAAAGPGAGAAAGPSGNQDPAARRAAFGRARAGQPRNGGNRARRDRTDTDRARRQAAPAAPPRRFPEEGGQAGNRTAGGKAHGCSGEEGEGDPLQGYDEPLGLLHFGGRSLLLVADHDGATEGHRLFGGARSGAPEGDEPRTAILAAVQGALSRYRPLQGLAEAQWRGAAGRSFRVRSGHEGGHNASPSCRVESAPPAPLQSSFAALSSSGLFPLSSKRGQGRKSGSHTSPAK